MCRINCIAIWDINAYPTNQLFPSAQHEWTRPKSPNDIILGQQTGEQKIHCSRIVICDLNKKISVAVKIVSVETCMKGACICLLHISFLQPHTHTHRETKQKKVVVRMPHDGTMIIGESGSNWAAERACVDCLAGCVLMVDARCW